MRFVTAGSRLLFGSCSLPALESAAGVESGPTRYQVRLRPPPAHLKFQQHSLVVDNPIKCNLALCLAAPCWRCHVGSEYAMGLMWQRNNCHPALNIASAIIR
jgi:hypothetical protein